MGLSGYLCCGVKKVPKKDKSKKKTGNAPTLPPAASAPDSPADSAATTERDGGSIVLENHSAVQAGSKEGSPNPDKLQYPLYEKVKNEDKCDKPPTATASESSSSGAAANTVDSSTNFLQNLPKFDEKYNVSLTRTSIADTVISEQISVSTEGSQIELLQSQVSQVSQASQVSQLDNKVTTFEEKTPKIEMEPVPVLGSSEMPSSVSCKSLESAVRMYAPSPKTKRASSTGTDNFIRELDGEVHETMEIASVIPEQHSMSISTDRDSKTYTYNGQGDGDNSSAVVQGDGVEASVATSNDEPAASADRTELMEEVPQTASILSSSPKQPPVTGVDNNMDVIAREGPAALDKVDSMEQSAGNSADGMSLQMPIDGSLTSALVSNGKPVESVNQSDNPSLDMNDNFAVPHQFNASVSCISEDCKSEDAETVSTHSAEVFAVVNDDKATNQISNYYSAVQLDRELSSHSLDISQDSGSVERSEMRFLIGVDKRVSSSGATTPSRECDSPGTQRADLFVNIGADSADSGRLERSEYYSPHRLERQLTPDSIRTASMELSPQGQIDSTTSKRSELHLQVKGANLIIDKESELNLCEVEVHLPEVAKSSENSSDMAENPGNDSLTTTELKLDVEDNVADLPTTKPVSLEVVVDSVLPSHVEPSEAFSVAMRSDTDMADGVTGGSLELPSPSASDVHSTSSVSSGSVEYARTQMTETEEMIETSVEETVTMVITGVVINPGCEEEVILSMQDAVEKGLLDLQNGIYHNSLSGENMSFIDAMNAGYIKMGPRTVEKGTEKVKSVGIIKITTTRETMPYTVKAAKDTRDGKMYHVFQATRRNILDTERSTFVDLKTGEKMLIGDAVDLELVEVEYDKFASELVQEEITTTYSVHAVIDQKEKCKVAFHEAVSRGLIDQETGEYINSISGERVAVQEAISKGFIKATRANDPDDVTVDSMGSRVAEQAINTIKNKMLNPLKVLKEMKH